MPSGGDPATDGGRPGGHARRPGRRRQRGDLLHRAWPSGAYDAVLVDASDAELSRSLFWLRVPGERPVLRSEQWRYDVGEPIRSAGKGRRGNRFDWIGIYARDADPHVAYYKGYLYTRGRSWAAHVPVAAPEDGRCDRGATPPICW